MPLYKQQSFSLQSISMAVGSSFFGRSALKASFHPDQPFLPAAKWHGLGILHVGKGGEGKTFLPIINFCLFHLYVLGYLDAMGHFLKTLDILL